MSETEIRNREKRANLRLQGGEKNGDKSDKGDRKI